MNSNILIIIVCKSSQIGFVRKCLINVVHQMVTMGSLELCYYVLLNDILFIFVRTPIALVQQSFLLELQYYLGLS